MIIILILLTIQLSEQHLISLAQGKLRGVVQDGYESYIGIPYASVSAPEGRFKAAGLAPTWNDIRESKLPHCYPSSVEECLKLDVHVPNRDSTNWPILVWMTGGGNGYNPRMLVEQGVILVIVYHRIGALGFLCLGEDMIPGNAGLKDTVLALRWVRDNIVAFKGNPAKVTVAGQGFSAAMVEALMLSPMSHGLYHGVILQSGCILCSWAFNYDAKERAKAFASMFNDNNITNIKTEHFDSNSNKLNVTYFPFGICIDKNVKRQENFLYDAPYNILVDGKANNVPMIIGYNTEEAYIFASILKETFKAGRKIRNDISYLLPKELQFVNDREAKQVAKYIEDTYFRNKNISDLIKFHTDAYFINNIFRCAHLHASSSHYPVYVYQFSHLGNIGVQEDKDIRKAGAAHSDELAYLFGDERNLEAEDEIVQRNVLKLWTNFVKYLNPTPNNDPVQWEQVNFDNPRLLDVSTELRMIETPNQNALKMWNVIYEKYYYNKRSRLEN